MLEGEGEAGDEDERRSTDQIERKNGAFASLKRLKEEKEEMEKNLQSLLLYRLSLFRCSQLQSKQK